MRMERRQRADRRFRVLVNVAGLACIAVLLGIMLMLLYNAAAFFLRSDPIDFITATQWNPDTRFGLLPLLAGSLLVTVGALVIAVPLGIGSALFVAEYAGAAKHWLKPLIEMLAAVPTVVIGFLAIVVVGPAVAGLFGLHSGLNAITGSIGIAVMVLPTIITVAEDALNAVATELKEASYAVGATKWTTTWRVVLPAAYPGIIAAVMLGMGRAIGETMTVLMATGNAAAFPEGFFSSVRTITATIAIEMGEVPFNTTHYFALFAIALVLFLITLTVNLLAERVARRIRRFH